MGPNSITYEVIQSCFRDQDTESENQLAQYAFKEVYQFLSVRYAEDPTTNVDEKYDVIESIAGKLVITFKDVPQVHPEYFHDIFKAFTRDRLYTLIEQSHEV